MSAKSVQLCLNRFPREEGRKPFAYNDATGQRVTCQPGGNLSIGMGINLENGLDNAEIDWLTFHRLSLTDEQLNQFTWYVGLDSEPARQSVFLDIGFNAGVHGLLHFPKMIAYGAVKDWKNCAAQCTVAHEDLDKSRYAPLRALILSGDTAL